VSLLGCQRQKLAGRLLMPVMVKVVAQRGMSGMLGSRIRRVVESTLSTRAKWMLGLRADAEQRATEGF